VKVMVAPAIANAAIDKRAQSRRDGAAPAKPKRRRSSVYDADGNEVFITLMCLKCHKMRPLSQFGLRKMADGAIRNQPWCRTCRSGAGAEKGGRSKSSAGAADIQAAGAPTADDPIASAAEAAEVPAAQRSSSTVAAEVAAALAGGMRR
jgi:hypothetical protein